MKYFTKKFNLGLVSLSAALLLAACADDVENQTSPLVENPVEETQDIEESTTEDATVDGEDTTDGIYGIEFEITLEDAVQTFHDTFGQDIAIDEVEFDQDFENYEYRISGWDAEYDYELDMNAETGEVNEQETDSDTEAGHTIDFDNIISPAEAMDVAVEAAGSDFVEEWTITDENGLTIYEIGMNNEEDVEMDAATGSVIAD